jgi:hypothetical protein
VFYIFKYPEVMSSNFDITLHSKITIAQQNIKITVIMDFIPRMFCSKLHVWPFSNLMK